MSQIVPEQTSPAPGGGTTTLEQVDERTETVKAWVTLVWDDPVNLMSYVSYVFQTVLGYDKKRANELMMQVHTEGRAVVSSGDRDKVEADRARPELSRLGRAIAARLPGARPHPYPDPVTDSADADPGALHTHATGLAARFRALIGLAAAVFLLGMGRVMGASGLIAGVLQRVERAMKERSR